MPTKRPVFKTDDLRPLRIVFEHTKGRLKGIYCITGLSTEFGEGPLPTEAEGVTINDRFVPFAGLVKVTRSYALYREPIVAENLKTFDARQQ